MESTRISFKDGRVFTNKFFSHYINGEISNRVNLVYDTLPFKSDILKVNFNPDCVELLLGKMIFDKGFSDHLKKDYFKFYEDFSGCRKITYDVVGDVLTFSDDCIITDMLNEKNLSDLTHSKKMEWLYKVSEFVMYVIMNRNPFVYSMFTNETNKLKKFLNGLGNVKLAKTLENLFNYIDSLESIEKVAKTMGEDFIFDNIAGEFELNNEGKKLHQVVELPLFVANGMKKIGIEESYNHFKIIAECDKGFAVTLMEFLLAFRKIFPSKYFWLKPHFLRFVSSISNLMQTGLYNSMIVLLNYLVNENMSYSNFQIPYREAEELYDFIKIALEMKKYNEDIVFDKLPNNIQKSLNVMNKNQSIINNPREKEFEEAVEKQKFLNDDWDDNYIFVTPKTELDLLNEGNALSHCVASYRDRIIDSNCKVVFMRKKITPEISFVTIEYDGGMAMQIKENFNIDVSDVDIVAAVGRYLARAERRERKC